MPNGLNRLAKAGYTDLEIFGYREDTGKFGDYNPKNTTFIASKDYKKMVDDAGLRISSSHLTPSVREYREYAQIRRVLEKGNRYPCRARC